MKRKRDPAIPGWYCAHGLPKGYEASVFRARGFAPVPPTKTYTRMVEVAGYTLETGHAEDGALWMWVPAPLAHLISCGAELRHRVLMCTKLNTLDMIAREHLTIELDAAVRLAGAAEGFTAILGPCPGSDEVHDAWSRIYPPNEKRRDAGYRIRR